MAPNAIPNVVDSLVFVYRVTGQQ